MSSMGGNGVKADYPGVKTTGFKKPYDIIPADVGGGCVKTGPFAKYADPPFQHGFANRRQYDRELGPNRKSPNGRSGQPSL